MGIEWRNGSSSNCRLIDRLEIFSSFHAIGTFTYSYFIPTFTCLGEGNCLAIVHELSLCCVRFSRLSRFSDAIYVIFSLYALVPSFLYISFLFHFFSVCLTIL